MPQELKLISILPQHTTSQIPILQEVPFGLAQAPAYFQELMTGILKDFPFTIAYLDNIIIFSKTPQEHLSHIHMVFKKFKAANLSMKKSKCSFFSKEIQYLGHILSATGI